jgi:hypothetical protein
MIPSERVNVMYLWWKFLYVFDDDGRTTRSEQMKHWRDALLLTPPGAFPTDLRGRVDFVNRPQGADPTLLLTPPQADEPGLEKRQLYMLGPAIDWKMPLHVRQLPTHDNIARVIASFVMTMPQNLIDEAQKHIDISFVS